MPAVQSVAGDVYTIQNDADGVPVVVDLPPFALQELASMGTDKPNAGFSYATALTHESSGIQIGRGRIAAGGMSAAHASPNRYILYVVAGSGTLVLFDKHDVQTGTTIAYKPEDVIVFEPNVVHAWQNASQTPLDFVGVDLPPSRV